MANAAPSTDPSDTPATKMGSESARPSATEMTVSPAGQAEAAPREPTPRAPVPSNEPDPPAQAPAEPSPTAAPASPSPATHAGIDLLHAVPTQLAVSSEYRGRADYVGRLVDGNITSAWNSRSRDLVGAYIDFRLPAGAQVERLMMTSGFARVNDRGMDLFAGNHRVTKVKVSRDGQALGEFTLDPDSRELQPIAVSGGAGVYRIEVLRTQAGNRADWRETCISELRVIGTAPNAEPNQHQPVLAIGELPSADARPEAPAQPDDAPAAPTPSDSAPSVAQADAPSAPRPPPALPAAGPTPTPEDTARALRRRGYWFSNKWLEMVQLGTMGTEQDPQDVRQARRLRRTILDRVIEIVLPIDRQAAVAVNNTIRSRDLRSGFVESVTALSKVAEFAGTDDAKCRWARDEMRLRVRLAAAYVDNAREIAEVTEFEGGVTPNADDLQVVFEEVQDLVAMLEGNSNGAFRRFARVYPPALVDPEITELFETGKTRASDVSTFCSR